MRMDIDRKELDLLLGAFQISKQVAKRAAERAVRKAAKWTGGQAAKVTGAELRVQQRFIRQRLRLFRKGDGAEQKIWLGLNAVAVQRLGLARQGPRGVRIGQHFFDKAFIIKKYGGGVYTRPSSDRFPISSVKLEIDEAGERAIRAVAARAEERLLTLLRQELNFELSRIGKR
jgi:hypothetical protein